MATNMDAPGGVTIRVIGAKIPITVGSRIRFAEERRPYTVRAANNRFLVCTKPFNLKHTVLYSVVDFKRQIRGTENLIFGMGAETDEQCRAMLVRLVSGESEVSHRNNVILNITLIDGPNAAAGENL